MAETIVLDPTEVATSRTQIDITPWIADEGVDWGDGEIAAFVAELPRGASPVDYRVPNRNISMPLVIKTAGTVTFAQARTQLQNKVARIQQEGGWLKRVTASGGTVFADLVNASLTLSGSWMQAHKSVDVDASLTLEATPDFYGAEIDMGDNVETALPHIVFTEAGILGDYPARCRLAVDMDSAVDQRTLLWALRSRYYSSSAANRSYYPVAELTSYGSPTVLANDWTPLYLTDRDSGTAPTGALIHVGTYRVWAHVTTVGGSVDMRLAWGVGDLSSPSFNDTVTTPEVAGDYLVDLGEVRLDPSPVGTHRWQGVIQGKAATIANSVQVTHFYVLPADEGYGVLKASPVSSNIGLNGYVGRDGFAHVAGALNAKTAPVGGAWATSGAATDFQCVSTTHVERTAISESGSTVQVPGRHAISGMANATTSAVQVDLRQSAIPPSVTAGQGVVLRWTNLTNTLFVWLLPATAGTFIYIRKMVAGVRTTLDEVITPWSGPGVYGRMRLQADANGRWQFWYRPDQEEIQGAPMMSGQDADLATGGVLASGKAGFWDVHDFGNANTRGYDNFQAWPYTPDSVLHASQSAQLGTTGMFREDAAGAAYGPVGHVVGDLPRLPPAGTEGRTCELTLKPSRSDLDQLADIASGGDDISVRAFYRPSYLLLP